MEVGKRRQEKEIGGGRGKRDRPRGVREAEDAKVEETQEEKKRQKMNKQKEMTGERGPGDLSWARGKSRHSSYQAVGQEHNRLFSTLHKLMTHGLQLFAALQLH